MSAERQPAVVTIGAWTLSVDVEATQTAYAAVRKSGPESCPCAGCRNFIAVRDRAYPPAALSLFEQLGIIPLREANVVAVRFDDDGHAVYSIEFHAIGTVEGPDSDDTPGYPLAPGFRVWMRASDSNALRPLAGQSLVKVSATTAVPWILDEPMHDP